MHHKSNLKCDNINVGPLEHNKVMRIGFYSGISTLLRKASDSLSFSDMRGHEDSYMQRKEKTFYRI